MTLNQASTTLLIGPFIISGVELLRGKHAGSRYWQEGAAPSASVGQETWSRVTDLIAALGTPPEAAARAAAVGWEVAPAQAYASFMTRNELRTEGSVWDRLFYEIVGNKVLSLLSWPPESVG